MRRLTTLRKIALGAIIGTAAAAIGSLLILTGALSLQENATWEWRVGSFARQGPATGEIAVILIDQKSLDWAKEVNDLGWPWKRQAYEPIIAFCKRAGAKALAFDMVFTEPSVSGAADDRKFGAAIAKGPPFVGAIFLGRKGAGEGTKLAADDADPGIAPPSVLDEEPSGPPPVIGDEADLPPPIDEGADAAPPLPPEAPGAPQAADRHGRVTAWPAAVPAPPFEIANLPAWLAERPGSRFTCATADFPIPEVGMSARVLGSVAAAVKGEESLLARVPLFFGFDGKVVPSLAVGAFLAGSENFPKDEIAVDGDRLAVAGKVVPIDDAMRAILRYRGPAGTYRCFSAAAVIQSELLLREGKPPTIDGASAFKDRYVFFGTSVPALGDLWEAPVGKEYPGVEVHATALDNLLSGDFMGEAPLWLVLLVTALLAAGSAIAVVMSKNGWHSVIALCAFAPLPVVAGFAAYPLGWWWPIVGPEAAVVLALVAGVVTNYATEGRQRRFIKSAFTYYLSPDVIKRIVNDPSQLKLGGERQELSILFSDLEGFSTISERLDAHDLTALLNDFLTDMTDIIQEEGGTLDKYEGDAIIAFWNAPLLQVDHAVRACRAALRCQRKLAARREEFLKRTGATLRMRVGINTGIVVVGNMGSRQRFNYTVLGDAANLASRLEGANKAFRTYFMVSEATWSLTGGAFIGRELGEIRVVGRKTPVRVFEPMGFNGEAAPPELAAFERGRAFCRERRWAEALAEFESCGGDPAATIYAERCRAQLEHPEAPWDGVWNLTEK